MSDLSEWEDEMQRRIAKAKADRLTMAGWLLIANAGNPLPPSLYAQLTDAKFVQDGTITTAGWDAMKDALNAASA